MSFQFQPVVLFSAVAISSTDTVKSPVFSGECGAFISGGTTSTATGALIMECCNLPDTEYDAVIGAVGGESKAARAAKEASNTTGWQPESMLCSGGAATGAAPSTLTGSVAIIAGSTFTASVSPGPRRRRLSYTNASNSGALSARLQTRYSTK